MTETLSSSNERRPELEQAFQHLIERASATDLSGITDPQQQWLAVNRAMLPQYGAVGETPNLEGVVFKSVSADGVSAEWVSAPGASGAHRIVWIHGGGWSAGSPADYRSMSATLAQLSGASVLMIDYRLAPEHPYPAGLDDCVRAYAWALENGPQVTDGRTESITLMGDSAGGNLAAATCLRLIDEGHRMPDRLALIAATLDNVSHPERIGFDDPICSPEALTTTVGFYLTAGHHPTDSCVSPAFASTEALAKFPPTLLQVSTSEALLYDSKKFADRLEKAGVRISLSLWPALPHVWHAFLGLFPEAREALAEIADFSRMP